MKNFGPSGLFFGVLVSLFCFCAAPTNKNADNRDFPMTSYNEPHRPQFHFSPPAHWMNDPNGMFFLDGEYHLFYQYYPEGTVWGPMHWGHAVSKDLIYWEPLPIALFPDSLGYIFSGSAVFDVNNSSGLGTLQNPPVVAVFTYHDPIGEQAGKADYQVQGIAYSLDKGYSWTKYAGNPVLPNLEKIRDFRDPKVSYHEPSGKWIMALAAYDHIRFYASTNLLQWEFLSSWGTEYGGHGGVWECPDLFPLWVDGQKKWVLLVSINPGGPNGGSATQYFVGDFDGHSFFLDAKFEPLVQNGKGMWIDFGRDNYAGVTWSGIPEEDGRRLFMGWMSNWDYANVVPTKTWRSAMTIPRTLHLFSTPAGYRLKTAPAKELKRLRTSKTKINAQTINSESPLPIVQTTSSSGLKMEMKLRFLLPKHQKPAFGIRLSNETGEMYDIGYQSAMEKFFSDRTLAGNHGFSDKFATDRHWSSVVSDTQQVELHLFVDVSSVELFANDGSYVLTDIFFPTQPFNKVELFVENGEVKVEEGVWYDLEGIW